MKLSEIAIPYLYDILNIAVLLSENKKFIIYKLKYSLVTNN